MSFRPALFTPIFVLVFGSSSLVRAADEGGTSLDGGVARGIDSGAVDSAASFDVAVVSDVTAATPDAAAVTPDVVAEADTRATSDLSPVADASWTPDGVAATDTSVALDTSSGKDAYVPVDTFVAIDLVAAVDGGTKVSDGGAGDGGSGPPPVYLPDGGTQGWVADETGCSFGGGRPARGTMLIPLSGLVALWMVRRRGRR
jgi:hypothetical protein